ncbi:flavin reductase family protein [Streptomyces sp. NPDC051985]|uniref:flavin reductase family protein n=1 Tax=Streptomyces sp. NPDC051985 TaxID=3155807 RepID=UPI00342A1A06
MAADHVDADHFRRVLGNYPTGVAVITSADDDGAPLGLTVGTFTSVSLDPALVAFLPDKKSQSWARIRPTGRFCVNILAEHQEGVCRTFARSAAQKFDAITWHRSPSGLPLLDDAVAWIECDLWSVFDAGDHDIAVGRVRALDAPSASRPLLFFQGGYGRFTAGSMATGEADLSPWFRLVDRARPHMEQISSELSVVVTATVVTHGEEVVVATAGGTSPRVFDLVGSRQKLIPPVGITHMALSADADIERWLAPLPAGTHASMRGTVDAVRERGYTVAVASPELTEFTRSWATSEVTTPRSDLPINPGGVDLDVAKDVHSLHAPAFGPDGRVQMILNIFLGSRAGAAGPSAAQAARLLLKSTNELTAFLAD